MLTHCYEGPAEIQCKGRREKTLRYPLVALSYQLLLRKGDLITVTRQTNININSQCNPHSQVLCGSFTSEGTQVQKKARSMIQDKNGF